MFTLWISDLLPLLRIAACERVAKIWQINDLGCSRTEEVMGAGEVRKKGGRGADGK